MKIGIITALLAVALTGTGCSVTRHSHSSSAEESPLPSVSPSSTTTEGGIVVTPAGGVTVNSGNLGPLRLGDHNVVYPYSDSVEGNWTSVASTDLSDRSDLTPHDVGHTEFDAGLINWVASVGDWVAYADQSHRQGDADPNVLWQVHAVHVTSRQDIVLASNGDVADPYVPIIHGQDGYFFWTQAEPDRTAKELIWKPGAGSPTAILRHAEMTPGSESVTDGNLVYLGPAADRGDRNHTAGGDCWQLPLTTGGTPEPLTTTALAMGCEANNGDLVWTEHIDPTTEDLPPDGLLDDPYELWAQHIGGGEPVLLHRGYIQSGYPGIGDGFALWQASDGTRIVQNLQNGKTHELAKTDTGYKPAVISGKYVAHAGENAGQATTIHIYKVRAQ